MSLFRPTREARSITYQDLFRTGADMSVLGGKVDYRSVTGLDAVAACIGLLSDVVYMLPVDVYRDRAGVADPLVTPPEFVAHPSNVLDARTWRVQVLVSWLLWGNVYGLVVERDSHLYPRVVEILDPATVQVDQPSSLVRPTFKVGGVPMQPDDILHLPGRYVRPGSAVGIAPLERFKETFGLALAARQFGAGWFSEGAHPSAILQSSEPIDEQQAKTIKRRFIEAVRGRREPAVLGAGMQYTPIQANPEESQFLATQDHQVVAVARVFGLPPEMVAAAATGSSLTYANREQRAIDFLTFAIDPWLVRFEGMWTDNLPRPQYAKFNRGALTRTDLLTRYRAHDIAIRGGFATVNERRALEDLPPVEGGDERLWPPYRTAPLDSDKETV